MLPLAEPERFADRLAGFAPAVLVTQDFHRASGFGADTSDAALNIACERSWGDREYRRFVELLRVRTTVYEGEAGFFPPPAAP